MSFFEIEPMGARHYGGINVGGMPVGGGPISNMLGMFGLGAKGVPLSAEAKANMKRNRALTKQALEQKADEIMRANPAVSARVALAMAKDIGVPGTKTKKGKLTSEQKLANFQKRQLPGYVPEARGPPSQWANIRKRIGARHKSSLTNEYFTAEDLAELDAWLRTKGYGVEDLQGSGFFDDVWHGIKNVGSTALHMAPHLLPLMM